MDFLLLGDVCHRRLKPPPPPFLPPRACFLRPLLLLFVPPPPPLLAPALLATTLNTSRTGSVGGATASGPAIAATLTALSTAFGTGWPLAIHCCITHLVSHASCAVCSVLHAAAAQRQRRQMLSICAPRRMHACPSAANHSRGRAHASSSLFSRPQVSFQQAVSRGCDNLLSTRARCRLTERPRGHQSMKERTAAPCPAAAAPRGPGDQSTSRHPGEQSSSR